MSEYAIRANGLGKSYELGAPPGLLSFKTALRNLLPGSRPAPARQTFWALEDVSFDIRDGEAVGIIGRNGAGKSTLLKILSRITEPSRGRVVVSGRVASRLEVGPGFHPELTGRENIFMNGSILGMRRSEILRRFDEIVEFADVSQFVDTPVKHYSSGMYVRLAFSVAAYLQPEILIIDEVLAVGDVQFQKKCLGKMDDVAKSGRTVLFVSHNMAAIRQLTTRCILLKKGSVFFDGDPSKAIELYADVLSNGFEQGADLAAWPRKPADLDRAVEIRSLAFDRKFPVFRPDEPLTFDVSVRARQSVKSVRVSGTLFHSEGYPIGSFFCDEGRPIAAGEERNLKVTMRRMNLAPGTYSFALALGRGDETTGHRDFDIIFDVLPFEIGAIAGEAGAKSAWPPNWGAVRFERPTSVESAAATEEAAELSAIAQDK